MSNHSSTDRNGDIDAQVASSVGEKSSNVVVKDEAIAGADS